MPPVLTVRRTAATSASPSSGTGLSRIASAGLVALVAAATFLSAGGDSTIFDSIIRPAYASCYDGATPLMMEPPRNAAGDYICGVGYHCPNFDPSNPATFPEYCPPSMQCLIERGFGAECEPFGDQEPQVCPEGYYCPTATDVIECPKGYFCTFGTSEPHKCPALALCPAGTYKFAYFGGILASVLLFIAFFIILALYRLKLRFSELNDNYAEATRFTRAVSARTPTAQAIVDNSIGRNMAVTSASTQALADDQRQIASEQHMDFVTISSRQQAIEVLAGGFLNARSTKPLKYEIKDLKVWAPKSKSSSRKGQLYGKEAKERQRLLDEMAEAKRREDIANGLSPADSNDGEPLSFFDRIRNRRETRRNNNRIAILQGVTATLAPSTVTAIMGPGGSGKSTLLNALLGRLPAGWTHEGYVAVNGDDSPDVLTRLRRVTGSATQTEPLHRELTVYENMYYNAQARLPHDWTKDERDWFLSATIEALQLVKQRDINIGDEENRGVSGGQRRRCHIGIEIAAAPYALFLDEPTNGLDATTALEVCSCLSAIASGADLTVVMTISQPRIEIWNALDNIIVIARGGRTVYQGTRADAQLFFEQNYKIPFNATSNPADIIVDAVAEKGPLLADEWDKHTSDPNYFPPLVRPKDNKKGSVMAIEAPNNTADTNNATDVAKEGGPLGSPMSPDTFTPGVRQTTASAFSRAEEDGGAEVSGGGLPGAVSEPATPNVGPSHSNPSHGAINGDATTSKGDTAVVCVINSSNNTTNDHRTISDAKSSAAEVEANGSPDAEAADEECPRRRRLFGRRHSPNHIVVNRRNAPIWRQIILIHNRSVAKQLSDLQPFVVEQLVNLVVALVLGFSSTEYSPYWSFKYYQMVSPPESNFLPQVFMYCSMALGVVCVMPGSAVFVNSRETYFREAGAGFSRIAYYLGTVISLQPRVILTSLVFATLFQIVPRLTPSFGAIFLFSWLIASCSYALGIIPAMMFSPATAPLVGTLLVIFFSCLSGFIMNFPVGLKYLSYSYWACSLLQRYFQATVEDVYEDLAPAGAWISDDIGLCVGICILILFILHFIAFLLMTFLHRAKQR